MEGADRDSTSGPLPFILERTAFVIFLNQPWSEYILMVFPGVVSCGISLPLDEILKVSAPSKIAMIDDGLDLIFLFSINDVWGRTREIVSILASFPEWR